MRSVNRKIQILHKTTIDFKMGGKVLSTTSKERAMNQKNPQEKKVALSFRSEPIFGSLAVTQLSAVATRGHDFN